MDFNADRAKESAIDTGAAVVGAVAGLAVVNKVTDMITQKSPSSTLAKHVPAIALAVMLGLQAMDIVPSDNQMVNSAIQGASVVTGMQAVREYSGANGTNTSAGLAHIVNQYVPAFASDGQATTAATSAAVQAALNGLGNAPLIDYRDPAQAALAAGRSMAPLKSLGSAPVASGAGGLKVLG